MMNCEVLVSYKVLRATTYTPSISKQIHIVRYFDKKPKFVTITFSIFCAETSKECHNKSDRNGKDTFEVLMEESESKCSKKPLKVKLNTGHVLQLLI